MRRLFTVLLVLFLVSTLVPTGSAQSLSNFSSELKVDHTYQWQVVNYTINDTLYTERSGNHLIAKGSYVKVTVTKDPTVVNLSKSLDVSDYFDMTYDDTIANDLSTLHFLTIAGQLKMQYAIYWQDLIYFIFPIINDQGTNFFDTRIENQVGLTFVDVRASVTVKKIDTEFYFRQNLTGSYDFEIIFDYSSGVMQHASYTDDSTNVTIVLDDIFEVSNNFNLYISSLFVITGIIIVTITYKKKHSWCI